MIKGQNVGVATATLAIRHSPPMHVRAYSLETVFQMGTHISGVQYLEVAGVQLVK